MDLESLKNNRLVFAITILVSIAIAIQALSFLYNWLPISPDLGPIV